MRNVDELTSPTMHHSFRPPLPDLKSQTSWNSSLFLQFLWSEIEQIRPKSLCLRGEVNSSTFLILFSSFLLPLALKHLFRYRNSPYTFNLNWVICGSIWTDLLRIKDSQKFSTYPRVCLRFSQILMHQDISAYFSSKKKMWNLLNLFTHTKPIKNPEPWTLYLCFTQKFT